MSYNIEEMKGLKGPFITKLNQAGIITIDDLLSACSSKKQRNEIAGITGISAQYLLTYTQKAELLKLGGINAEYHQLLSEAGVETLEDLVGKKAKVLSDEIQAINTQKNITDLTPATFVLDDWIDKAKDFQSSIEM